VSSRRHDDSSGASKASVARRLLTQFTAKRPHDLFGMVAFSGLPIRIVDFTQKADVISAALAASTIGRGLSDTDIGRGMLAALGIVRGKPFNPSPHTRDILDKAAKTAWKMSKVIAYEDTQTWAGSHVFPDRQWLDPNLDMAVDLAWMRTADNYRDLDARIAFRSEQKVFEKKRSAGTGSGNSKVLRRLIRH